MSTPAWKPLPSARRITTRALGSRPAVAQRVGELEPARDRQRVHRRVVDGDDDDVLARFRADHARSILPAMNATGGAELVAGDVAGRGAGGAARHSRATSSPTSRSSVRGYTGLWTAYALKRADPSLRIVVCEREVVGFGASGRNGGWCSALFAGSRDATVRRHGRDAVVAMQRAMFATLDEIERVLGDEGIACDWARGGTIQVATIPAHLAPPARGARRPSEVGIRRRRLPRALTADSSALIGCRPNLGGLFTPHCAAIHPAKARARPRGRG